MKNILLLFFSLFCLQLMLFSQSKYIKILGNDTISILGENIIVVNNDNYIIAGYKNNMNSLTGYAHLSKYNTYGELLIEKDTSIQDSFILHSDIVKTDYNSFWLYSILDSLSEGNNMKYLFSEYDYNLNLIRKFNIDLPDSLDVWNLSLRSKIRYFNNELFWADKCKSNNTVYDFLYRLNTNGDSLQFILYENQNIDDYKIFNKNSIFTTGVGFNGLFITVNKMNYSDFTIDTLYDTSNLPNLYMGILLDEKTYVDVLSDTTVVFSAIDLQPQVNVSVFDTSLNLLYNTTLGISEPEFSAMKNGIGVSTDNFIFIANDFLGAGGWLLTKLNDTLNIVWEKFIPIENNLELQSIVPTNDGGCLMLGLCSVFNLQQAVIVKTDENGNVTSVNDDDLQYFSHDLILYPNPGNENLNIQTAVQSLGGIFNLYDISGKEVLNTKIIEQHSTIDTKHLPAGTYLYEYLLEGKTIETGKWMKK